MNDTRTGLLAIGAFASEAQLSIKALRLYDQLGILRPSYVDPYSGYRYYHASQLRPARLIRMLRQIGMPLASIRHMLALAPAEAERVAAEHCRLLEARAARARTTLREITAHLKGEPAMALEVEVRNPGPQPIVSINRHVKVDQLSQHIRESVAQLQQIAADQGETATGAPFGIYHGAVNDHDDGPIEVCLPVSRLLTPSGDAIARELPAGPVAVATLRGSQCEFPAVLECYDVTIDWIRQHGYEPAGAPREIWLGEPGADASDDHMEIAWPFHEAGA